MTQRLSVNEYDIDDVVYYRKHHEYDGTIFKVCWINKEHVELKSLLTGDVEKDKIITKEYYKLPQYKKQPSLRITPIFNLFGTANKRAAGKDNTILLKQFEVQHYLIKANLIELLTTHTEFMNFLRDAVELLNKTK